MARATMITVVAILALPGLSVDGLLTMPVATPACRAAAVAAAADPRAQGFQMHNPRPCRARAAAAAMCRGASEGAGRDCGGQTELLDGREGLRGRPASASAPKTWHPIRMLSLVAAAGIGWQCQPGAAAAEGMLNMKGAPAVERTLVERTLVERTLLQTWPRWQLAFTDDDVDELQDGELDGQNAKLAFTDDEQEMSAVSGEGEHEQQGGMIENKEPEIRVRGTDRTLLFFLLAFKCGLASVCASCLTGVWVFRQLTMPLSAAFLHGKVLRRRVLGHRCGSALYFVLGALPPPCLVPWGALPNQRDSSPT